jgi:hypothetical protein
MYDTEGGVIVALSVVASYFLVYALYTSHAFALKIIKSANVGSARSVFGKRPRAKEPRCYPTSTSAASTFN